MMYTYPYYGFPRRYTRYNAYYPQSAKENTTSYPHNSHINPENTNNTSKTSLALQKVEPSKENRDSAPDKPLFELFGIKLYFDDVLLICLIFFLYQEGVQDQYLFISLILLLLS